MVGTLLIVTLEAACAFAETPGDLFRKKMADRKAYCDNRRLSPGETTCNILLLKTADPAETPGGRLAHSISLPPTVPARAYRFGMTSEQYLQELCQEAGEFIFTRVKDVEGVMQLRPRTPVSHEMLQHLYAFEDPYGHQDWEAREAELFYVRPDRYSFLEKPAVPEQPTGHVIRYHGYDGRNSGTMQKESAEIPRSQYGFTWRGISRPNDREMGIAGGELIVVDIKTLEVLGVKRGFARTGEASPVPIGIWWSAASTCPGDTHRPFGSIEFVMKVLTPLQR